VQEGYQKIRHNPGIILSLFPVKPQIAMSPLSNMQITAILDTLVRINDERIKWYEKALAELQPEDRDLVGVFQTHIRRSQAHNEFLAEEIRDLEEEYALRNTLTQSWSGALYGGPNRHALLLNCEKGEIATQTAYRRVLENPQLPGYLHELLGEQREDLEKMHRRILSLKATAI
jgi:hypothetical protein